MNYIACFIGHRKVINREKTFKLLVHSVRLLIILRKVSIFLVGSRGEFNDLVLDALNLVKKEFSKIKIVYVRAEYKEISEDYKDYLLEFYDDSYYPENVAGSNKLCYIKRNQHMIDRSDICIFYYNDSYLPPLKNLKKIERAQISNSGTQLAFEYANKKNKEIINLFIK